MATDLPLFANPFAHPNFWAVLQQIAIMLLGGIGVVLLFNIHNIRNTFHSKIGLHFFYWQLAIAPFLLIPFFGLIISLATMIFLIIYSLKLFCNFLLLPHAYLVFLYLLTLFSLTVALFFPKYENFLPFFYLISLSVFVLWFRQLENVLVNLSLSLFGAIWIIYSMNHAVLIALREDGLQQLVVLTVAVIMADFCAFALIEIYLGSDVVKHSKKVQFFDRRLLLLSLIGYMIGALIGINLLKFIKPTLSLESEWLLGMAIGASTFLGKSLFDLMRRYIEIKDVVYFSSKPSGVFDRMSLFFISIVVYFHYFIGGGYSLHT